VADIDGPLVTEASRAVVDITLPGHVGELPCLGVNDEE
jgi:hypothetical protein